MITMRRQRSRAGNGRDVIAAVIRFTLKRADLSSMKDLVLISDNSNGDYWGFVEHCRNEHYPLHDLPTPYDAVYGPVSAWPQRILFKDCDQIGLHTEQALAKLCSPEIVDLGTPKLAV